MYAVQKFLQVIYYLQFFMQNYIAYYLMCCKGDFEYRVHIQNSGWTDWTKADGVATLGTVGQALRIEAIQFR